MKLTKERQKQTGAFYTPKQWAELAVEYMKTYLPLPLEYYVFYDPAGGEGALLEALPKGCEKYATTLEPEDVEIMKRKGIKAWQFDFLNDDTALLPHRIHQAGQLKRLVIFMNPPYVKLPANPKSYAQETYNSNDSVELFYYRLAYELRPLFLCSFNKVDLLQTESFIRFRDIFTTGRPLLKCFITPSTSWGLKGKFPISFMMWSCQMTTEEYEQEYAQKMERWQQLYELLPERYTDPSQWKIHPEIAKIMPTSDEVGNKNLNLKL